MRRTRGCIRCWHSPRRSTLRPVSTICGHHPSGGAPGYRSRGWRWFTPHPYGGLDWIAIALAFAALFLLPVSPSQRGTILVWVAANAIIAAGFMPWALILAEHAHAIDSAGFWIP